ncbi:hypothetical protein KEJ39_02535, partial [Candidatus Bathyarchaeota archaeon]|nr:hypothetical protein [Candidatus Bathyarchaeota archaeon]
KPLNPNFLRTLTLAEILIATLMISFVQGEPPTPPPLNVEWNPPNTGATGGQSQYIMAGWSSANTLVVWTSAQAYHSGNAEAGTPKSRFNLNEPVYLYVDTPIGSLDNFIWLYEYHQSNQSSGRWRFWRREIGFGRFMFGPFYPDQSQPSGNYTWKVWIVESDSGEYQSQVLSFVWGEEIPELHNSSLGAILALLLVLPILLRFRSGTCESRRMW